MSDDQVTLGQLRQLMSRSSLRWKIRTLKSFKGSFEAWRFMDPKAVEAALMVAGTTGYKVGSKFRFTTKAQRKAVKKLLNAPAASEEVSST